jgi:hypothetical protein
MRRTAATSTIAEVELPTEEFALAETFEAAPDVTFELVRVVAHDESTAIPSPWAMCGDIDALEADPTIEDVELLERFNGEYPFRTRWVYEIRVLVHVLTRERRRSSTPAAGSASPRTSVSRSSPRSVGATTTFPGRSTSAGSPRSSTSPVRRSPNACDAATGR